MTFFSFEISLLSYFKSVYVYNNYIIIITHLQKFAILLNCFWSGHEKKLSVWAE